MTGEIWGNDRAVEQTGRGQEMLARQREPVESDQFRTRTEVPSMQHSLCVVDRDLGRQHLVQDRGDRSNNGYEDEFLHEPRVVERTTHDRRCVVRPVSTGWSPRSTLLVCLFRRAPAVYFRMLLGRRWRSTSL